MSHPTSFQDLQESLHPLLHHSKQKSIMDQSNCVMIQKSQFKQLQSKINQYVETIQTCNLEIEMLRNSKEELLKREKAMIASHLREVELLKSKIEEKQLPQKPIVQPNRELDLELYKEKLENKRLVKELERVGGQYKQLENRFLTNLKRNIQIVKGLKEKQLALLKENERLRGTLGLLGKNSIASKFIHQLVPS